MQQREQWNSNLGFILAAIGSAVGLGNIWRFSYLTYDNGGGAFLVPYLIALLLVGIPVLLLEMGLGHRARAATPQSISNCQRRDCQSKGDADSLYQRKSQLKNAAICCQNSRLPSASQSGGILNRLSKPSTAETPSQQ